MNTTLQIFELRWPSGDADWVVAANKAQALVLHNDFTGMDEWDMEGVEITIIPENKWETYSVLDIDNFGEDGNPVILESFKDVVLRGETGIIATTNY